jgi:hypothetical protein
MANKTDTLNDELKVALDNLKNLQTQHDDLSQKICDFEFQLSKLDLSDTSVAINVLQSVTQSLETHHAILEKIDNEIPIASNRVVVAQRKVNEVASKSLRDAEISVYKDCIQKLIDLEKSLSKLGGVQRSLWNQYQVLRTYFFSSRLISTVDNEIDAIRHRTPELLGLGPNLTPAEIRYREAVHNVEARRECVDHLKALREKFSRGEYSVEFEDDLGEANRNLAQAEAALAAL